MYKYYFFDLDGTLTKSEEGIFNCIKYALDWAEIPYPEPEVFKKFIGPPLVDSFMRYMGMDREYAEKMCSKYRERYNVVGLFENEVYEGIYELLEGLKARGAKIGLATSKPAEPARRILEKFELAKYFDVIAGTNPDGSGATKPDLITKGLTAFGLEHGCKEAVMIGDRFYDIEGGVACGIDTIGVLYGYGDEEELRDAGATHIVATAIEVLNK